MGTKDLQISTSTALLIILSVVGIVLVGPLVSIWAINTLFPVAGIPYSWPTWLAMTWLHMTLFSRTVRVNK